MQHRRVPGVTYRLQLGPGAGFDQAADLVGYLAALGVTHVYLSPVTDAEPGSEHGYDVTDHTTVRPELGGDQGLTHLAAAAQGAGLGLVVDIVPNHASIVTPRHNRRWWETLRGGHGHPSARFFDVDWDAQDGRVLLPVLTAPLADELAAGRLTPTTAPGPDGQPEPVLHYGDPADNDVGLDLPLAEGTADLPLPELLDAQHYRLLAWHRRLRNLRRFFVIDSLAALRAEDELVADELDTVPRRLWCDGRADGLRVDHVDGLAGPGRYLQRLRRDAPDAWIVVEKILAAGERLPTSWPVAGTTGYDFVRLVDHLLLDPGGERPLTELWHDLTGDARPFAELSRQARREVLAEALAPDLARVAAQATRAWPEADPARLTKALATLTVETDRYRTYLADDDPDQPEGPAVIDALAARATAQRPDLTDEIAGLAELLLSPPSPAAVALVTRWQQLTAPTVAKGDEDRAFYRYQRLTALCEVGGEPGAFGLPPDDFHAENSWRAEHLGASMLAGTTHDTKRSEDVRARLLVLAEIPDRWRSFAQPLLDELGGAAAPAASAADRYLALQAAVGAWPIDAERLTAFLVKAAREASQHTTWTDTDDAYEDALAAVAGHLTSGPGGEAVSRFVAGIARAGWSNSLAQLVLRLTSPGVPDIYQGTETWHLRLVDPDNRVPPDWPALAAQLTRAATCDVAEAWARPDDGLIKTAVLARVLAVRAERPSAFGPGASYVPLEPEGSRADHAVAYCRGPAGGEAEVVVAVTRLPLTLADDWADTTLPLPDGEWVDALRPERTLSGGRRPASDIFAGLPVAVLTRCPR